MEGKTANGVKCGTFGASSIEERFIATGDHAGKLVSKLDDVTIMHACIDA